MEAASPAQETVVCNPDRSGEIPVFFTGEAITEHLPEGVAFLTDAAAILSMSLSGR